MGWKFFIFFYNSSLVSLLKIEFPRSSPIIYTHVFYINTFDLVFFEGVNDTLDPRPPPLPPKTSLGVWGGMTPWPHPPTLRPCACIFLTLSLIIFFCSPLLKAQVYRLFAINFTLGTTHLSSPVLRGKHSKQNVYEKWITIYILTFGRGPVIQRDLSEEN